MTEQVARPRVASTDRPKRPSGRLNPRWRKVMLIAHVATSVGWLGSAYGMAVLGLVASRAEPAFRHASYEIVHASDRMVMIPLSLLSLVTGLVVSLGTQWGLAKHYWVFAKFAGTLGAMLFAALYLSQWVKQLVALTADDPSADIGGLGRLVVLGSVAMAVVLLGNTALSVVKPWGRAARGRRAAVAARHGGASR